jgi:formate hydrogenlyase subunit 6/NADH:ubiquinone oxidoreductase subunit I
MSVFVIETDKAGLQKFYEEIIGKHETYAPVEKFGKYDFKRVSKLSECNPDSPIETTMSIKPLFFPKTAKVMKFHEDSSGTTVSETDEDPLSGQRVILGVKHCDARSLQVLDKVYNWDYVDTDYQTRRLNTVIVSTRCDKAGNQCFCTSLDYDVENSDAHDIRVINGSNGKIYIQGITEKGESLLKASSIQHPASSIQDPASGSAVEQISNHYNAFASSFRLKMDYKAVNERLQKLFDSPEFDSVSSNCIGCNTCAFICPTCHCFKISDEKIKDTGVRYKSYDSCNNGYFTLMAGGHNPRPVKYRRWRQRAMHKFVYYKERFGENLCVGCGKCAISCPVNISIFDVVNQLVKSE